MFHVERPLLPPEDRQSMEPQPNELAAGSNRLKVCLPDLAASSPHDSAKSGELVGSSRFREPKIARPVRTSAYALVDSTTDGTGCVILAPRHPISMSPLPRA